MGGAVSSSVISPPPPLSSPPSLFHSICSRWSKVWPPDTSCGASTPVIIKMISHIESNLKQLLARLVEALQASDRLLTPEQNLNCAMKEREAGRWIVIAYDLPNEPSKIRVRAWRNLKTMGALYPSVSLCILPGTKQVKQEIERLRPEFNKRGFIIALDARTIGETDSQLLLKLFQEDRRRQYEEIREECEEFLDEINQNLANGKTTAEETEELEQTFEALQRWYRAVEAKGYGRSEDKAKVLVILKKCKQSLASFSARAQPKKVNISSSKKGQI